MNARFAPIGRATAELRAHGLADLQAGLFVSLIALPLSLGIALASGFPPVAGLITAMVAGLVIAPMAGAPLTIKGPAAGLIVIALNAVTHLGDGDPVTGYRRALAVGVVAAVLQIAFGALRLGRFGSAFPPSVIHGMLAAIGVILIGRQAHTLVGVKPEGHEPLELLAEIPHSLMHLNPEVALIGAISLALMFGLPALPIPDKYRPPSPIVVLAATVPIALYLDFPHSHTYSFAGHVWEVGPDLLVALPRSLADAVTFPDFSQITSFTSIQYIVLFALIGSLESTLTGRAVDGLRPEAPKADLDRDLLVVGVGNLICAFLGGLPMISEIVRSSASVGAGAKTRWASFFHGALLLASVVALPGLLQRVPLAALAGMLVYTGVRLAHPHEIKRVLSIGRDQLAVFTTTLVVTLATDLLVGIAAGILLKLALHAWRGVPLRGALTSRFEVVAHPERARLVLPPAAVFAAYPRLEAGLVALAASPAHHLEIDLTGCTIVDHTVMEGLHAFAHDQERAGRHVHFVGLDHMACASSHPLAVRLRRAG